MAWSDEVELCVDDVRRVFSDDTANITLTWIPNAAFNATTGVRQEAIQSINLKANRLPRTMLRRRPEGGGDSLIDEAIYEVQFADCIFPPAVTPSIIEPGLYRITDLDDSIVREVVQVDQECERKLFVVRARKVR